MFFERIVAKFKYYCECSAVEQAKDVRITYVASESGEFPCRRDRLLPSQH